MRRAGEFRLVFRPMAMWITLILASLAKVKRSAVGGSGVKDKMVYKQHRTLDFRWLFYREQRGGLTVSLRLYKNLKLRKIG